jgi:hypothetical protein
MVCSAATARPSSGYYALAHPRAKTDKARHDAWTREHEEVVREAAKFPASL